MEKRRESRVSERQQLDRREEKCNEKAKKRKTGVPETSKNRIEKAEGIPSINRRQTLGSIQLKSKRIL